MSFYIFHPFGWPILSLLALAFVKPKSKITTIFNILIVGLYIYIIYRIVPWPDYGSYYLRYFYIFLFLIACIRPITKINSIPLFKKASRWGWGVLISKAISFTIFLTIIGEVISSSSIKELKTINLKFPLKNGTYYIHQGGTGILNYHKGIFQKYSLDIIKLNNWGQAWSGKLFEPKQLKFYNIYKDTVYSPCNGIITKKIDHYDDHGIAPFNQLTKKKSNVIEIITPSNNKILLLHFSKNSIFVEQGDTIKTGQPLALVGNTGKSAHPHLHIGAFKNDENLIGSGLVILFDNKLLIRNDLFIQ